MAIESLPPASPTPESLALLARLTEAVGISGGEAEVRDIVAEKLDPHAERMEIDALGNLLAFHRAPGDRRPKIMVCAHMDEVGMMISGIDKSGFLRFKPVGGLAIQTLGGRQVWIGREKIPGVIGLPPIHLLSEEKWKSELKVDDLRIDIGASSKEEAEEKVRLGAQVTFATRLHQQEGSIWAKALDDRLGVAILVELFQNPPPGIELLAAFTVQEEVGLRGAQAAAHRLQPDFGLALDCAPARDFPTWEGGKNDRYVSHLREGPAIYVMDGRTIADKRWVDLITRSAQENGIQYQIRQPLSGGTDAGALHLSREGVPSVSLSVPARHLHGPVGLIDVADWRAAARLVYASLANLPASDLWQAD
jgi:putative aminopeptidase FrvX